MFTFMTIALAFTGMLVLGGCLFPMAVAKQLSHQTSMHSTVAILNELDRTGEHGDRFQAQLSLTRKHVAKHNRWLRVGRGFEVAALACAAFCILAGVDLLSGWVDPLSTADPAELSKAAARGRGRGGIILLAIRFWPWVLILSGGYFAYTAVPDVASWSWRWTKAKLQNA